MQKKKVHTRTHTHPHTRDNMEHARQASHSMMVMMMMMVLRFITFHCELIISFWLLRILFTFMVENN